MLQKQWKPCCYVNVWFADVSTAVICLFVSSKVLHRNTLFLEQHLWISLCPLFYVVPQCTQRASRIGKRITWSLESADFWLNVAYDHVKFFVDSICVDTICSSFLCVKFSAPCQRGSDKLSSLASSFKPSLLPLLFVEPFLTM